MSYAIVLHSRWAQDSPTRILVDPEPGYHLDHFRLARATNGKRQLNNRAGLGIRNVNVLGCVGLAAECIGVGERNLEGTTVTRLELAGLRELRDQMAGQTRAVDLICRSDSVTVAAVYLAALRKGRRFGAGRWIERLDRCAVARPPDESSKLQTSSCPFLSAP